MKRFIRRSNRLRRSRSAEPFFSNDHASETGFFSPEVKSPFFNQLAVQTKLSVGKPNDMYEQQADAMADRFLQRQEEEEEVQMSVQRQAEEEEVQMSVQRQEEEEEVLQMQSEEEEEALQAKTEGCNCQPSDNLQLQLQSSKGGGQPVPAAIRQPLQDAFGADFNSVRIHTDNTAVQMNKQLNAHAFTHGSDIYFNSGQFKPHSQEGQHLLAHELTHTLQQGAVEKIQRRALPGIAGSVIGNYEISLPAAAGQLIQGNITARQEMVLSAESEGTFNGFADESVARNLARQNVHTVTAIVADDEDRYHVYPTDLASLEPDMSNIIIPVESGNHLRRIGFENIHRRNTETDRSNWVDRVTQAFQVITGGDQLGGANQLAQLMSEATAVPLADIHVMQSAEDTRPGINFNVFLTGAYGRGGIRNLPADHSSAIPEITLQVGKGAFYSNSPDILRATFVHELTHLAQARRSVELLQNWRTSDSGLSFIAWLNVQEHQHAITRNERLLTEGFIHNNDDNTETLAHLNAFVHAYPNLPLSMNDVTLFRSLFTMTQYWLGADRDLQEQAISRIISFHSDLLPQYQQRMAQYIAIQSTNTQDGHRQIPFARMQAGIHT